MIEYKDIVLVDNTQIIDIVRRTLSKIDSRLIDHGERVAFISRQIYDFCKEKPNINLSKLLVLSILHDIGAYKTNEIDDMVRFETEKSMDHSLYGYLFLKNTTYLSDFSEAILYHHTDYTKLKDINSICSEYAQLIFLADRTDILLHSNVCDFTRIKKLSGSKFDPKYVDALMCAESEGCISSFIKSENFKHGFSQMIKSLNIKNTEIMDYLKLLVYAIDFRSPYTVTHTADTTVISMEIGRLALLDDISLQKLYFGAFLHDIGKIAIPHDILEKPVKLTYEEFNIIKTHIYEGEQILRGVVSDEICNIALRHHEKINGSGYPNGIKGNELTVCERIVAVADILSALTQRRSYKEPFPKSKVLKILNEMKDSNLICPRIVEIVNNNYDLIMRNAEKSLDPVKSMYKNLLNEYQYRMSIMNY